MTKSTAKAEAMLRDLKDRLEFRGFVVAESKDVDGWPKLVINTDEASIRMEAAGAVSPDIFGNLNLIAFTPHFIDFAARLDGVDVLKTSKIMMELVKMGVDRIIVKTHASVLASAEAVAGDEVIYDVRFPLKGN